MKLCAAHVNQHKTGLQNSQDWSERKPGRCSNLVILKSCNPVVVLPNRLAQDHLCNDRRSLCRLRVSSMKSGDLQERFAGP